jgi:hypothetical protein
MLSFKAMFERTYTGSQAHHHCPNQFQNQTFDGGIFTLIPTKISDGRRADACWPVPCWTPVMAKAQKKTKKNYLNRQSIRARIMVNCTQAIIANQSSYPKFLTTHTRQ